MRDETQQPIEEEQTIEEKQAYLYELAALEACTASRREFIRHKMEMERILERLDAINSPEEQEEETQRKGAGKQ